MLKWIRRFSIFVLRVVWVAVAVAIITTWVNTARNLEHATDPPNGLKLFDVSMLVIVSVGLGVAFFFVAGLEIAYTDLRDKDPFQVSPEVRDLLIEMQNNEEVVYEAREWLGALLIVTFAYLADFDTIYVPFLGQKHWRLFFNLVFTTAPLVWFAQEPAKFLALRNSERFLQRARPFWVLFRIVGWTLRVLQIRAVSIFVARSFAFVGQIFFGRKPTERRNLPPSNSAYYMSSLKRYGYALHNMHDEATISREGTFKLTQVGIVHVVAGGRSQFSPKFDFGGRIVSHSIRIVRACNLPQAGEKVEDVCAQITKWANNECSECKPHEPARFRTTGQVVDKGGKAQNQLVVEIKSPFTLPDGATGTRAFALEYEISIETEPGTFETTSGRPDYWERLFSFPCRQWSVLIIMENPDLDFANPWLRVLLDDRNHLMEEKRTASAVSTEDKRLSLSVTYPLPGASYRLNWDVW